MKMETFIRKCRVSSRLSSALLCAVIGLYALCAQSCRTQKETSVEKRTESLQDSLLSEIRVVKPVTVPPSEVGLEIPVENLLKLPPSASYTKRSGQASVSVSRQGDTVYIDAGCDSLRMLVEYYERELTRIHSQTGIREQENESRSVGFRTAFKYVFSGFLAGIIITVIIYKRRK